MPAERRNRWAPCYDCGAFKTAQICLLTYWTERSADIAITGLMMLADIPYERGLSHADIRWGDGTQCNFPLFSWLSPLPLQWMYVIYWIMLAGI